MKQLITHIALIASATVVHAGNTYVSTDFNRGIPSDYTLICNDMMQVATQDYNRISTSGTWFSGEVAGANGKAAISASRRDIPDAPTDNWLITPLIHIASDNAWLRWDARSVHHDLRDGYTVMVSDNGMTGFKPLLTICEENYIWTTRLLPLADYAGKDIYIGICHNATNKFMLAVDNIFVGEPADIALKCKNTSPHFTGNTATATMTGTVTNTGRTLNMKEFVLTTSTGQTFAMPYAETLSTGGTANYSIDIPVEPGTTYRYTVKAVANNGTEQEIASDMLVCSHFPRTMLIEKFTGLWCNNCPTASPFVYAIEEKLGREAAFVEVHGYSTSLDPLSNDAYAAELNVKAYPTVLYNRNTEHTQNGLWSDMTYLEAAMTEPTDGYIEAEAQWTEDNRIAITCRSQLAADHDNSINKYRIGYILKEKILPNTTGLPQYNNCSLLQDQEFRYLPSRIPSYMLTFHNLARGGETTGSYAATGGAIGFKGSLPTSIKANEVYLVEDTLDIPASVADVQQLAVIAVLYKSSMAMNVAQIDNISQTSGISSTKTNTDTGIGIIHCGNGNYKATLPCNCHYKINIHNISGTLISTLCGKGHECNINLNEAPQGCYIIQVSQNDDTKTVKVIKD